MVLSMTVYTGSVGASGSSPALLRLGVLRIAGLFVTFPAGNGLICSRGLSVAIPTENVSSGMGFRKESSRLIFG